MESDRNPNAITLHVVRTACLIALALALTGYATGCSHGTDASDASAGNETSDVSEEASPEEQNEPIVEVSYDLVDRDNVNIQHDFSEGRAWVEFEKEGDAYLGVIDETGTLHYSLNLDEFNEATQNGENDFANRNAIANMRAVWFQDGVSYYGAADAGVDYADFGFVIIDKDGNELFKSDDGDDSTEFEMRGFADGIFVVEEHIEDFSHDDYVIFAMDAHGNKLTDDFEVVHSGSNGQYRYYGEGVFSDGQAILNVNGNAYLYNRSHVIGERWFEWCIPVTSFYEGRAVASGGQSISLDDLASNDAVERWLDACEDAREGDGLAFGDLSIVSNADFSWGEGLFYIGDGEFEPGWYNLDGKLAVAAPDFGEDIEIESARNFSGGYAPIEVKGKDWEMYVTVVDREGNIMFDPVKRAFAYPAAEIANVGTSWKGYFAVDSDGDAGEDPDAGDYLVMDSTGKVYEIGVDDLSAMGDDAKLHLGFDHKRDNYIMGGFVYSDTSRESYSETETAARFYSLDGKTVIDSCYE